MHAEDRPTRDQLDRENRIALIACALAFTALVLMGCAGLLPS